jgi:hypothetical protein
MHSWQCTRGMRGFADGSEGGLTGTECNEKGKRSWLAKLVVLHRKLRCALAVLGNTLMRSSGVSVIPTESTSNSRAAPLELAVEGSCKLNVRLGSSGITAMQRSFM